MFPLWVVGKGEEGNPLTPLQVRAGTGHRNTGQRRTEGRVTKAVTGRAAAGAGKGRQVQNIAGQEIGTQSEEKMGISGSTERYWWMEKNHYSSLGNWTH